MIVASVHVFFIFFLQAEDGIRDIGVTGVQTCALPIFSNLPIVSDKAESASCKLAATIASGEDRKSVVQGKSVDLGGRRIIKKKNNCGLFDVRLKDKSRLHGHQIGLCFLA